MKILLKSGEIISGTCTRISPSVVQLTFNGDIPDKEDLNGFSTVRENGEKLFDGSGYVTLYRTVDGGYQLSNDGSVYVPPAYPDPITEPEPDPGYDIPAGPTLEERVEIVEGAVMELSEILYA